MKTAYTMTNQQLRKYYRYHGDMIIRMSFSCDYKYENGSGCEYNSPWKVFGNWTHLTTDKTYCKTHAIKMVESGQIKKAEK